MRLKLSTRHLLPDAVYAAWAYVYIGFYATMGAYCAYNDGRGGSAIGGHDVEIGKPLSGRLTS
jgi:hypothetical protein